MYSEIKTETKILINRADDNERILLQTIYNESKKEDKELKLESLLDENGDFSGVMLEVVDKETPVEPEEIEVIEEDSQVEQI